MCTQVQIPLRVQLLATFINGMAAARADEGRGEAYLLPLPVQDANAATRFLESVSQQLFELFSLLGCPDGMVSAEEFNNALWVASVAEGATLVEVQGWMSDVTHLQWRHPPVENKMST